MVDTRRRIKVELKLTEGTDSGSGYYSGERTLVSTEFQVELPVPNTDGLVPLVTTQVQALIDVATEKGLVPTVASLPDRDEDEIDRANLDALESDPGFPPQDS